MRGSRASPLIVVFGGAGYVGSVVTQELLRRGYRIRVFDILRFGPAPLAEVRGHPNFELVEGDIRRIAEATASIEGAHAVILLAALVGEPDCDRNPKETVDVNLLATKTLAEACRYYEIPRFIFASTDSAYGIQEGVMTEEMPLNPTSLYARLKMRVEREILDLHDERFRPAVLRMATIYGLSPRMRFDLIVNTLSRDAFTKGKITIYGGKQWRPLVHVADAARAYAMCLEAPLDAVGGQMFNVGSNEQNYQICELGELMRSVFPEVEIDTVPQSPDLRDYHVSFDKISRVLGYRVEHSVTDGIREIRTALADGRIQDPMDRRYYNFVRE